MPLGFGEAMSDETTEKPKLDLRAILVAAVVAVSASLGISLGVPATVPADAGECECLDEAATRAVVQDELANLTAVESKDPAAEAEVEPEVINVDE